MAARLDVYRRSLARPRLQPGRLAARRFCSRRVDIRRIVRERALCWVSSHRDFRLRQGASRQRRRARICVRPRPAGEADRLDLSAGRTPQDCAPPGEHPPGSQVSARSIRGYAGDLQAADRGEPGSAHRAARNRNSAVPRRRRSPLSERHRANRRRAPRRHPHRRAHPGPGRSLLQQRGQRGRFAFAALRQVASRSLRRVRSPRLRLDREDLRDSALGFFPGPGKPQAARARRATRRAEHLLGGRLRRGDHPPAPSGDAAGERLERRLVRRFARSGSAPADFAHARARDRARHAARDQYRYDRDHRSSRQGRGEIAAVYRGHPRGRGARLRRGISLRKTRQHSDRPHVRRAARCARIRPPSRWSGRRKPVESIAVTALMLTFQELILELQSYWGSKGCALLQPYDMEMGAGTFHTATFLRAIGPEPWRAAYVQPSRRPKDGRYGDNPNRLQHYYQYQVVLKPSPGDLQDLYLGSLKALGIDLHKNDVRFVEDDWESPTLGAWGLGWEVWLNGMEVTQFTYFQQVGGLDCKPVLGELTYGLERLAMYLQGRESVFDLTWVDGVTYGDVYHQNEVEQSKYNFEASDATWLLSQFNDYEAQGKRLIDARGSISVTERAAYIGRVRALAKLVAKAYYDSREKLGFPMLKQAETTK